MANFQIKNLIFGLLLISCSQQEIHWDYHGKFDASHWGEFTPFKQCGEGLRQSPVDLPLFTKKKSDDLEFFYHETEFDMINNGHTVMAIPNTKSYILHEKKLYQLLQFHMHTPSEHSINQQRYPLELHLVHKHQKDILVASVFVKSGRENGHINKIWKSLSLHKKTVHVDKMMNPIILIPANFDHYIYEGSLTTPPCTEGVKWLVFHQPIELSEEQIDEFKKDYHSNSRPIQELFNRNIEMD